MCSTRINFRVRFQHGETRATDAFHHAQEEMLRPALRIQGASEDGGDLLLQANLTEDRRAIMATTPSSTGPLTAGSHLLHVSLNGQFAGLNTSDMVRAG